MVQLLNKEQQNKARLFHKTMAILRGETYTEIDKYIAECMTGTYSNIVLYGGGDPEKAAHRIFSAENLL